MESGTRHTTQVPPAWHGAALRRALLPLNGLRTISTVAVMVRDYHVRISHWKAGLLWLRVQVCTGLLAARTAHHISVVILLPRLRSLLHLHRCFITCGCGATLAAKP